MLLLYLQHVVLYKIMMKPVDFSNYILLDVLCCHRIMFLVMCFFAVFISLYIAYRNTRKKYRSKHDAVFARGHCTP